MSEKELQELINLLYDGNLSQYGKRKLVDYIYNLQNELEYYKDKEDIEYDDFINRDRWE